MTLISVPKQRAAFLYVSYCNKSQANTEVKETVKNNILILSCALGLGKVHVYPLLFSFVVFLFMLFIL